MPTGMMISQLLKIIPFEQTVAAKFMLTIPLRGSVCNFVFIDYKTCSIMCSMEEDSTPTHVNNCTHNSSILLEWCNENHDNANIVVRTTKILEFKNEFLHFLLHLNEDFDDDLLQQAMQLLGYQ